MQTDMGKKGGRKPPLTPTQSVSAMLNVIESLTAADNGKFIDLNRREYAW